MIVREESLAGFSQDCQFDHFIKLGRGEEKSGGRDRDTILGDLFEAFFRCSLLDQEWKQSNLHLPGHDSKGWNGSIFSSRDYKTRLQRTVTGSRRCGIQYQVVGRSGPAHAKEFEVEVFVNGQTMGHGHGRSRN